MNSSVSHALNEIKKSVPHAEICWFFTLKECLLCNECIIMIHFSPSWFLINCNLKRSIQKNYYRRHFFNRFQCSKVKISSCFLLNKEVRSDFHFDHHWDISVYRNLHQMKQTESFFYSACLELGLTLYLFIP